ncbi:MAG: hypothetical protein IRY99_25995 [Isosphaeraceae bacterium]|nr:hypothetical protein [Isosphaeraceae bacterium]
MSYSDQTINEASKFDPSAFPPDVLIHDRRSGRDRRASTTGPGRPPTPGGGERRVKKERRRRVDPTTFEKQYTEDEIEFMNAMQRFKVQSGKAFPTYGEVLRVALSLGYRQVVSGKPADVDAPETSTPEPEPPNIRRP